ncbi:MULTISPECIES: hypothetical protein [unclassified Tenacibaculum]|uniref:hypothetical protein n=1 Tax=unclassified Tenacibaculum TaxID=2635139 RepID=UPI001F4808CE|nr:MULTISPECIES: hypothetical protein [unclassified Tenacibaculum]MCF2874062.1 hypothetical protein [Tenacibaculum sp. Cn5-1]MCF2934643.1 hypothetical protein [Tenacibaculum sp. Cn5-34]MCG7510853.1 hypothetical protein [Tenacibaculum sp. Cn5-46]
MLKNISNLGVSLNKLEQKSINGGTSVPPELCIPLPREVVICVVPLNENCCLEWEYV